MPGSDLETEPTEPGPLGKSTLGLGRRVNDQQFNTEHNGSLSSVFGTVSDCREEQYPCTRLYSVHKPCKQCLNSLCFYRWDNNHILSGGRNASYASALNPKCFFWKMNLYSLLAILMTSKTTKPHITGQAAERWYYISICFKGLSCCFMRLYVIKSTPPMIFLCSTDS